LFSFSWKCPVDLTKFRVFYLTDCRNAQREAEVYSQRAKEYASLLEESHAKCREAEHAASHAKSKIVLLEDKLERSDLQTAEVRQHLALLTISGAVTSNAVDDTDTLRMIRQVQQASEATAQELASATNEIYSLQQELSVAKENIYKLQQDLEDANRVVASKQEESHELGQELKAREEQLAEFVNLRQILLDADNRNPSRVSQDVNHVVSSNKQDEADTEANELAQESSLMAAKLTEELAISNTAKIELEKRIEELTARIKLLKSGTNGDLLSRIENLDRELVVARNKAEVNEIFRGEHDRLAKDLVTTKLALAEAQEQIIITKRALLKSQEKSMTFASKLTKLETKLYRKLSNVGRKHSSSSSG
jgi:chromosome segregation ATPase